MRKIADRLAALEALEAAADEAEQAAPPLPLDALLEAVAEGVRSGQLSPNPYHGFVGPVASDAVLRQYNALLDAGELAVILGITAEECEQAAALLDAGEIAVYGTPRGPHRHWFLSPRQPVAGGIVYHEYWPLCNLVARALRIYEELCRPATPPDSGADVAALLRRWAAECEDEQ